MGFCKLNNYAVRVIGADLHICISKDITYDDMFLIIKCCLILLYTCFVVKEKFTSSNG